MNKPVLFCYDGSDGSRTALAAAVELIKPADAVVLVVWMSAAVQLARAGSFLVAVPNEGEIDEQEAAAARQIATVKMNPLQAWFLYANLTGSGFFRFERFLQYDLHPANRSGYRLAHLLRRLRADLFSRLQRAGGRR